MNANASDLAEFHRFVAEQLASHGPTLSPEECLDAWRSEHPMPEEFAESIAAIQRGHEQMQAGQGVSWDEFDRAFRHEMGLSSDQ